MLVYRIGIYHPRRLERIEESQVFTRVFLSCELGFWVHVGYSIGDYRVAIRSRSIIISNAYLGSGRQFKVVWH